MTGTFDLSAQIRKAENDYNAAVTKNNEISQKIEMLEQARRYVSYAKVDANNVVKDINNFDMPDKWAGGRRNKFNNKRTGDLLDEAKGYVRDIEDLEKAIGKEISHQKSQMDYVAKLISSIDAGLARLNKQLHQHN